MKLFDHFRALFRFEAAAPDSASFHENNDSGVATDLTDAKRILAFERFETDMRHNVEAFALKLKNRYCASNTNKDTKFAIKIIAEHLERHGKFLWGHLVALQNGEEVYFKIIDRTNNVCIRLVCNEP